MEYVDVEWLRGKRVVTLLGVGNPAPIIDQLRTAGAAVTARIRARDHEHYERSKMTRVEHLCRGVDALVMTNKDWVKVRRLIDLPSWPVPIVVPWLEIDVFAGAEELKGLVLETMADSR